MSVRLMRINTAPRRLRSADIAGARVPLRSIQMLDLIMLAMGLGFFALTIGYAYACDRL